MVAVLDGGPGDVDVVDVALTACVSPGCTLHLVHAYQVPHGGPTPIVIDRALEYARGAVAVASRTARVPVTVACVPGDSGVGLQRELGAARLLIAPAALVGRLMHRLFGPRSRAHGCSVVGVPSTPATSDGTSRLPLGYRLALLRELERTPGRPDGAVTVEDLDDVWHVGVACPPLSRETVDAWSACTAWPPRSVPDD